MENFSEWGCIRPILFLGFKSQANETDGLVTQSTARSYLGDSVCWLDNQPSCVRFFIGYPVNRTTANLTKLTDFIWQNGLSDEDIVVADASRHEAKLHLEPAAFIRVTKEIEVKAFEFGSNIHKHAKANGILIVCVVRMELVQVSL